MQQALETAISKVNTQQYAVSEKANGMLHRCRYPKHTKPKLLKPKLLKPIVKSDLTLNITHELITPKFQFLIKITSKLF